MICGSSSWTVLRVIFIFMRMQIANAVHFVEVITRTSMTFTFLTLTHTHGPMWQWAEQHPVQDQVRFLGTTLSPGEDFHFPAQPNNVISFIQVN